jgi:hypothetical protein
VNRRSFLSLMGFAATAAIVKPTYFFAPRDGWGIKIYPVIGAWADYRNFSDIALQTAIDPDIRTATGLSLYYEQQFIANLKAATPLVRFLRDPRLPELPAAHGYQLNNPEIARLENECTSTEWRM